LEQAVAALETDEIDVFAVSPIIGSVALSPAQRRYANAAAIVSTSLAPPALLDRLQQIESHFGRDRRGQRWQPRTLDLDIILWSGGLWVSDAPPLAIPHPAFRQRNFVVAPATAIAPDWRDPVSNLSVRQHFQRLNRPKPLDPANNRH
jgi:2-amino-4-hydroxy-6-hydroxymethyldihydropteridine diphosphokinase